LCVRFGSCGVPSSQDAGPMRATLWCKALLVNLVILSQLFVCDYVSEGHFHVLCVCVCTMWRENVPPCEAAVRHFRVLPTTTSCYNVSDIDVQDCANGITYGVMVGFRLVFTPIPSRVMAPTIVSSVRPIVSGIVGVFQHPFRKPYPSSTHLAPMFWPHSSRNPVHAQLQI
jgi:hypothetical protein